jgi:hypothetical protein
MSDIAFLLFPNIQDFPCSKFTNFEQTTWVPIFCNFNPLQIVMV